MGIGRVYVNYYYTDFHGLKPIVLLTRVLAAVCVYYLVDFFQRYGRPVKKNILYCGVYGVFNKYMECLVL